jgi:hypothetical protein
MGAFLQRFAESLRDLIEQAGALTLGCTPLGLPYFLKQNLQNADHPQFD